jgi:hypothetical protein
VRTAIWLQSEKLRGLEGDERARLQATHQTELNQIAERRTGHNEDLATERRNLEALDAAARQTAADELQPRLDAVARALDQNTRELETLEEAERQRGTPEQVARGLERQRDVALRRALLWDKRAASKIEDEIRAHGRRQAWTDFNAAIPPADRGDGVPPAAPLTPPADH